MVDRLIGGDGPRAPFVAVLERGSLAARHLQDGDRLVRINGTQTQSAKQASKLLAAKDTCSPTSSSGAQEGCQGLQGQVAGQGGRKVVGANVGDCVLHNIR